MKPNWSCITCGMYSSRRYSVQRHINNKHNGDGTPIPFVEYLVGRRDGSYPPGPKPQYGVSTNQLDLMTKEVEKIRMQRVIDVVLPPPGHPSYAAQASALRAYLSALGRLEAFKLFREFSDSNSFP